MSDPVSWGVGIMLGCMGLADLVGVLAPLIRQWLDGRRAKEPIGYR